MYSGKKASLKMLVLDLDGTILNDKMEIIAENYKAIQELKKIHPETLICVATGRTYTTAIPFVRKIRANYLIVRDGKVIYSGFDNNNYISKKVFSKSAEDNLTISQQLKKPFVKMLCKSRTPLIKLWSKYSVLKYNIKSKFSFTDIKMPSLFSLYSINTHIKHLRKNGGNPKICKRSPFGTEQAIGPFSADKGKAIIYILEQLRKKGININRSEVAIVGNDYNDLEMLQLKGCQSFCPSNAIKPVKDLDNVIQLKANNNEPLLYELLERYNITINITGNSLEQFEARAKKNFPKHNNNIVHSNQSIKKQARTNDSLIL